MVMPLHSLLTHQVAEAQSPVGLQTLRWEPLSLGERVRVNLFRERLKKGDMVDFRPPQGSASR